LFSDLLKFGLVRAWATCRWHDCICSNNIYFFKKDISSLEHENQLDKGDYNKGKI